MVDGALFSLGKLNFYPYGLCMAIGIIGCFAFLMFAFTKSNFNDEAVDKILFIGIFATAFGIFMSMVFQALYDYIENPKLGYNLGSAMTFQGGLIGGVVSFLTVWNLYVFVIAPRTKIKFLQNNMNATLTDAMPIIPIGITIAHSFGRLGCTFAGCCHGAVTDKWYGIWMYTSEFGHAKVVPIQLFECLFLAALTGIMILLYFKFKFKYNFSLYAIAYGIWRFGIEFARDDHRGSFIGAISPSQFWSIIMVIFGIGLFFLHKYWLVRFEKHPQSQPPVRQPKAKRAAAAIDGGGTVANGSETVANGGETVANGSEAVANATLAEEDTTAAEASETGETSPNAPTDNKE